MDWFSPRTVADIKLIDMFENEWEKLGIRIDGGTVDGRAKVACIALFEHRCFFELDLVLALIKSLQVELRIAVASDILLLR